MPLQHDSFLMTSSPRVIRLAALCLFSALLAKAVASAPSPCVMSQPTTCSNTGWLHWSPGFSDKVKRFIGPAKVTYFRHNRSLSWQALYGLGGPPEERVPLPGHRYLFSACPAHDCGGQAAAIILDDRGEIEAIGFSSFHCCEPHPDLHHRYLDFYVTRGASAESLIAALREWGMGSTVTSMLQDAHLDDGIYNRISTHLLP